MPCALLLLAPLLAVPAQEQDRRREYYEDGALKAVYKIDSDGVRDGWYREYWPDGEDKVRAVYDRGVLDGRYRAWHEDGTPRLETRYSDGEPDGDWEEWWPDGTAPGGRTVDVDLEDVTIVAALHTENGVSA